MKKYFFIIIILLGFAGTANAESNFYIGGGLGTATMNGETFTTIDGSSDITYPIDGRDVRLDAEHELSFTDLNLKIFGGFRASEYAAVEIAFHRFGEGKSSPNADLVKLFNIIPDPDTSYNAKQLAGSVDTLGFSASILGIYPVTKTIEIFGKVGVLHSWLEATASKIVQASNAALVGDKLGKGSRTETGFAVIFGGGTILNLTENISLRTEIEYAPNIVGNHSDKSEKILAEINKIRATNGLAGKADYEVDIGILSTTASIVWNF